MILEEIIKQIKKKSTTSRTINYNCNICRDTTWIEGTNGMKRCECYKREKLKRMWQAFGVNPGDVKKINDYKPYDEKTKMAKEKAINYIQNFLTIKKNEDNCFGLFGQAGAGKSHLVIGIGATLLNKGFGVVYMPYLEATRQLKSNVNDDEYYLKLSERYLKADVLVIDDLFKDKVRNGKLIPGAVITSADMKHIYPVLNYRYFNKLPTIFSTECTPDMLNNLDEALAGRILETCEPYMTIFKGEQYNYRMRKFMKK
ncbi:MerR family transcriptional regulator [Clostridium tetani]|nr:MerR family transcriptional regulator [Clostridium tetani]RYU99435.1 MerR family transcriptional regulator [Clostridium tetani]